MKIISPTSHRPLKERTLQFAIDVRNFIRCVPKKFFLIEDFKQILRSSGSIGANYLEAQDAVSEKDFLHRIRICRKEAKESAYWLELISINIDPSQKEESLRLLGEARQISYILTAIAKKLEKPRTKK